MEMDKELVDAFCDEAGDLLSKWEVVCMSCAKDPNPEWMGELFRYAHNLKGTSRAVGLNKFGEVVHHIEDLITLLRDGNIPLSDEAIAVLLKSQNVLLEWVGNARENPENGASCDELIAEINAISQGTPAPAAETPAQEAQPAPVQAEVVDAFHDSKFVTIATPESAAPPAEHATHVKAKSNAQSETIRISAGKLDQILQVIGELSIHQSIVWHARSEVTGHSKLFQNSVQLTQKLTKELYDRALSLRMQPLQTVFQRLERNIFEISKTLGKPVEIKISGGDVELDKMVIEKILDPLTHIVRNAIDHGIESTETREANGKVSTGTIEICAKQDAFGVEIAIRDDGKGLAEQRILNKAIEKGLVRPDQKMSSAEIQNLIFLPGFSTAEKLTDVSGRGVGMDVVRKCLEDLRGTIAIDSVEGRGTSFSITLPTSVSIMDSILVTVNHEKYVVPLDSIIEVINVAGKDFSSDNTMINHNGSVLPIYPAGELLCRGRNMKRDSRDADNHSILICREGSQKIGLMVGKILGQQQIVVRPLSANIGDSFGLMGGTVLGDGEPGLIIDVSALVKHVLHQRGTREKAA